MSFKGFLDKLREKAGNFAELKIETAVIDETGAPTRKMVTEINMITSDVNNEFHTDFVTGGLAPLRPFHETQVGRAEKMFEARIDFVAKAFSKFAELARQEEEEAGETPQRETPSKPPREGNAELPNEVPDGDVG
jgi:hypothetical protein